MSFGVTPSGFVAKRFEDIVSDISTQINNTFNINIDSDPDNKIKTLVNIMTLPLAENWEVCQSLSAQMDIDQAADVFLDYLCAGKLIYRQAAVKSSGDVSVEISYNDELTLPEQSSFYNKVNQEFLTTSETVINKSSIHKAVLDFDPSTIDTEINLTLNGATFSRTIFSGDYNTALSNLINDIESADYNVDNVSGNLYEIYKEEFPVEETATFSINIVSGVAEDTSTIFKSASIVYVEDGDFAFPEKSLTIAPSFSAIISFENTAIVGGRYRETDEELRYRFKNSSSVVGKSTPASIKAAVLNIEGVTDVSLLVNTTMTASEEGNPPKSVEVIVNGGEDLEIGQTIYDFTAAGIELYGNTSVQVEDANEEPLIVFFSRIEPIYISVKVTYTKYDEEIFAGNGNSLISNSVVEYINNLEIGEDVIGGRVAANIYKNVDGVEDITIEMFSSSDINGSGTYSTSPIRISKKQEAITNPNKIIIQEA